MHTCLIEVKWLITHKGQWKLPLTSRYVLLILFCARLHDQYCVEISRIRSLKAIMNDWTVPRFSQMTLLKENYSSYRCRTNQDRTQWNINDTYSAAHQTQICCSGDRGIQSISRDFVPESKTILPCLCFIHVHAVSHVVKCAALQVLKEL